MTKTAYQLVHYRRFRQKSGKEESKDFEALCRMALSSKNNATSELWMRAEDRVFPFPAPEDKKILLNRVVDFEQSVFGEMCLVKEKNLQAVINMTAIKKKLSELTTAEIYTLSEQGAPHGTEFLRGILYWMAIGNHLFFVKLNQITPDDMHSYFSWLIEKALPEESKDLQFDFQAQFDPSVVPGDVGDIRNLRIKGTASKSVTVSTTLEAPHPQKTAVQSTRRVAEKVVQSMMAIPVIEALFGKTKTESLVQSLGPGEYLAVDAAVKIRGKRTSESRERIRAIATEVADMTDAEVRIDGSDGRVQNGDAILRVRMPFVIPQTGSSLLDFDNVATQLLEVYRRFVSDGKIGS